jgi:hypothetical protein
VSHEIEAAAGSAVGGFFKFGRHDEELPAPGTPCANCATPLMGPWCYRCGQVAEDFHRSIWKLIGEVFEGLLHFDGRVWRTLPDLFRHPARLTRAYLDGHRAPQIPPFRLFLVVLVAVFFAGSLGREPHFEPAATTINTDGEAISVKTRTLEQLSPEERAEAKKAIESGDIGLPSVQIEVDWLKDRVVKVLDDPQRFKLVLESWAERFAFLTLPMAALLISLAFMFQRRFYIFDHTIFSLHSLSAVGLMVAAYEALSSLFGRDAELILFGAPIHLFVHMRGVYGTSVIGTLLRMAFVFFGSIVLGSFIFLGLLLVGLNGMGE